MIKFNSKLAVRNFIKNKEFTFINIFGLAVGLAAFMLISLFIQYHLSYDKTNINYKNIYRIDQKVDLATVKEIYPCTPFPLGQRLIHDFPNIKYVARRMGCREFLSSGKDRTFYETRGMYADNDYLKIFTFQFVQGDPNTALKEPSSIVLTEELAKKYFPERNPMGEIIKFQSGLPCKVTGVIKRLPDNTTYKLNYIISFSTVRLSFEPKIEEYWDWCMPSTFVLLDPKTNVKEFNKKIYNVLGHYHTFKNPANKLMLWPLGKIHLQFTQENDSRGYMYLMGFIAFFTLIIACINFMNLSTAYSSVRIREISLRKISGASRILVIRQFLGEALAISLVSLIFAFAIAEIMLPFLNTLIDATLTIQLFSNAVFFLFVGAIAIFTGVLSGSYPAFYLSAISPVSALRGNTKSVSKNPLSRKILVIFQFTISIVLIICTISIFRQLDYMKKIDLGFNKENILIGNIQLNGENNYAQYDALKTELLNDPRVMKVSWSHNAPYFDDEWWEVNVEGKPKDQNFKVFHNHVDYDFINTFNIKIKEGRNLSENFPSDKQSACLINEEAAKRFGWEKSAIGKRIYNDDGHVYTVVGVMKNFHLYSIAQPIEPYFISFSTRKLSWPNAHAVKIAPHQDIVKMRKIITKTFQKYFPNDNIEFNLLDKNLDQENFEFISTLGTIVGIFAMLAIIISSIGLFGLVSFITKQRTKEIGIRKANGAVISDLFNLIIKEFIIILIIANVIAIPFAYFIATKIIGHFAYHISLGVGIFIIASILSLLITIFTISFHILKASRTNPVEALRYE
jgi:putative ABC transport system permease protein